MRLGDDPVAHRLVQRSLDRRRQQRAGVAGAQPADDALGEPGPAVAPRRRAHRDDHADRLGPQPARHERHRLRRRAVEPLGVVDQADQRLLAPDLGQQPEQRQADEEAIRRRARAQAERGAQRVALGAGRASSRSSIGAHSCCSAANANPVSDCDARGARDLAIGRPLGHVGQQRRLADARPRRAAPAPGSRRRARVEQPVERLALAVTAQEHQGPNLHRPRESRLGGSR